MFLIIGSKGMLGSTFVDVCKNAGYKYNGISRDNIDLHNLNDLENYISNLDITVIINCAAIINIDYCEKNKKKSAQINTLLPKFLSEYASENRIKLIHISTDHYYTDDENYKHDENDAVCILNEYAKQKYNAEYFVKKNKESLIIRTSILGYKHNSLVNWILKEIKYSKEIIGFKDSYTSSIDVYSLTIYILQHYHKLSGIYNIASSEVYSKYELIKNIINQINTNCKLKEGSIKNLSTSRANTNGLDCSKFSCSTNTKLPSLNDVINNLKISEKYYEL